MGPHIYIYIYKDIYISIDWWEISGYSIQGVFVSVITVCSQKGGGGVGWGDFYLSPAINL